MIYAAGAGFSVFAALVSVCCVFAFVPAFWKLAVCEPAFALLALPVLMSAAEDSVPAPFSSAFVSAFFAAGFFAGFLEEGFLLEGFFAVVLLWDALWDALVDGAEVEDWSFLAPQPTRAVTEKTKTRAKAAALLSVLFFMVQQIPF